jgi:hypothetical protein
MTHAGGGNGETNPYRIKKAFHSRNFASLKIEWKTNPLLKFAIHDNDGKVVRSQEITIE